MSFLDGIERWLEGQIEGTFRRRGTVQPVEIGRRLARVMQDQRRISVRHTYVPNVYQICLSPSDFANLQPFADSLSQEMTTFLGERAKRQRYMMVGPAEISWRQDESLSVGDIVVKTEFTSDPDEMNAPRLAPEEPHSAEPASRDDEVTSDTVVFRRSGAVSAISPVTAGPELVVTRGPDAGKHVRLVPGENRIGRADENRLVLGEVNVSRFHAVVLWEDGAFIARDLGSRNGIYRNGERLSECELRPGDELQIGLNLIRLRVG